MSKRKKILISIWLTTLIAILAISYIFAQTNSNPKFLTKLDKTIFSNKNEPAKFVLLLPDEDQSIVRKSTPVDVLKSDAVKITNPNEAAKLMPKIDSLETLYTMTSLSSAVSDDSKPWIAYSKQTTPHPNYYRISVIVKKIGLSERETDNIIKTINENTSLSFSPYAKNLKKDIEYARKYGNETYIDVNIKYESSNLIDFGPKAIDLSMKEDEIIENFSNSFLNTPSPFGGFIMYGKLEEESDKIEKMAALLDFVAKKGYLIVDATEDGSLDRIKTINLPRIKANSIVEGAIDKDNLANIIEEIEISAIQKGYSVVVLDPKPLSIITFMKWFDEFSPQYNYDEIKNGAKINKPFTLVPISSLVVE